MSFHSGHDPEEGEVLDDDYEGGGLEPGSRPEHTRTRGQKCDLPTSSEGTYDSLRLFPSSPIETRRTGGFGERVVQETGVGLRESSSGPHPQTTRTDVPTPTFPLSLRKVSVESLFGPRAPRSHGPSDVRSTLTALFPHSSRHPSTSRQVLYGLLYSRDSSSVGFQVRLPSNRSVHPKKEAGKVSIGESWTGTTETRPVPFSPQLVPSDPE